MAKAAAEASAAAQAAAQAAAEAARAKEPERLAQPAQAQREWREKDSGLQSELEDADPPIGDGTAPTIPDSETEGWPPLSPEDQRLVDAWWKEVWPVYTGKGKQEKSGWLLERTLGFLDQQPRLFRYLHLYDEFLFEVGAALARAGRMEENLALLRRLRQEQPETYWQCFGYYDVDLIAEALRTGRREDIPAYLDLFKQHPVKHIDQFADVVDLLAWRGCETELREMLEPTAQVIADSSDVIRGEFGVLWLTKLAMFPFVEAGDDSPPALDRLWQAAMAVGYLVKEADQNREWLRRAVRMASRSPAEAGLDLKNKKDDWFCNDVGWSFTGWVRRQKGLPWTSARFLADALLDYWGWEDEGKKKDASRFRLNETQLERYLAQRCRDIFLIKGLRGLSILQAFHYFTEYLVAHDDFSAADAARLQSASARLYESMRPALDACDPALRICPAYEVLIAGPALPATASS